MQWLAIIERFQVDVLERLESSEITIEGMGVLEARIAEILAAKEPLPVHRFLEGKEAIFPGDTIMGAAALLSLANAAEAGRKGDLDWLVFSLTSGAWAAALFLGTNPAKAAINELGGLADKFDKVVEGLREGGRNSHESSAPARLDRNQEIEAEFNALTQKRGLSKRSAASKLSERYDLSADHIRKIMRQKSGA